MTYTKSSSAEEELNVLPFQDLEADGVFANGLRPVVILLTSLWG